MDVIEIKALLEQSYHVVEKLFDVQNSRQLGGYFGGSLKLIGEASPLLFAFSQRFLGLPEGGYVTAG